MKPSKSKKRAKKKKTMKPLSPSPPQIQPMAQSNEEEEEEDDDDEKRALDLDWLTRAFASISIDQIASVYDETGRDAYRAAGVLGAQLIDSDEVVAEIDEKKDGYGVEMKEKEKRRKKKGVAASSGMVSDVIGKGYAKPSSNWGAKELKRGEVKGREYSVEEGEEFLCSMLGDESELGMGVVKDVLGQCGNEVEKALEALLDLSASFYNPFMEMGGVGQSCTYPELSSSVSLETTASSFQLADKTSDSTYHPSKLENDVLQSIGFDGRDDTICLTDSERQLPSKSRVVNLRLQQKVLESLFNIPDNPTCDPNGMNWKKVVKQVESFGQGLEYCNTNTTYPLLNVINGKKDEYQVSRSDARKHWDTMRTYYHKAAVAYSRGERANAAQLSETGRIHRKLARKADEEASKEIFEARNKDIKNTVTIDLHGQHGKQGMGLLKLHLMLFTYIPSIQFLKVITGCGDGIGKGKLKHSVINLVKKEGIEWCLENSGTLLLRLDGVKEYTFMGDDNHEYD